MPNADAKPLTQRELGSLLPAAIDNVRDSVEVSAWARAVTALDALLATVEISQTETAYLVGRLGPNRAAWLKARIAARYPSRSVGAGSDVDGVDLEVDRG